MRKLVRHGLYPDFSPDGSQIVYTNLSEGGELWIMNANGFDKHPIILEEYP